MKRVGTCGSRASCIVDCTGEYTVQKIAKSHGSGVKIVSGEKVYSVKMRTCANVCNKVVLTRVHVYYDILYDGGIDPRLNVLIY
jgi:hypothetical protein